MSKIKSIANKNSFTGLHLKNVTYHYEGAVMGYDFTLKEGATLALIGKSGSGKTTLLNLIAGFLNPNSGDMYFQENNFQGLSPEQRPITMLFQEHNLFPHLTVYENIAIGINPSMKLSKAEKDSIVQALIDVGLDDCTIRLPKSLSGGQRQRVTLARAIVRDRPLLLLDEPFSALDPGRKKSMLNLLKDLQEKRNITLLFSTHDPRDVEDFADHVAFIEQGKIIEFGPPADLLGDTRSKAIKAYLGE